MPRLCGACAGRIEDNQHFKECSICHRSFHLDHRCDEHPQARMVVIAPRYIPRRPEPSPPRFRLFNYHPENETAASEEQPAAPAEPDRTARLRPPAFARNHTHAFIGAAIVLLVVIGGYGGAAALGAVPWPIDLRSSANSGTDRQPTPGQPTPAKSKAAIQADATREAQLARSEVKYGPAKGTLAVDPDSLQAATTSAGSSLRDPLVHARFTNPESGTGSWDYGFIIRRTAEGHEYRIAITSRGEWICERLSGAADSPISRQHGQVAGLRTGPGQVNDVQLLIVAENGLLFVNDAYVATVDLSQAMQRGDVLIGAAFFPEHRTAVQTITYSDFQVLARGGKPKATPES
ncbi:MAG TPA: hypothetical protein VFL82_15790 [Thermomicrobiales bacterium]|nr:hypothetical protein [Thermomicrobiales bacterium]